MIFQIKTRAMIGSFLMISSKTPVFFAMCSIDNFIARFRAHVNRNVHKSQYLIRILTGDILKSTVLHPTLPRQGGENLLNVFNPLAPSPWRPATSSVESERVKVRGKGMRHPWVLVKTLDKDSQTL